MHTVISDNWNIMYLDSIRKALSGRVHTNVPDFIIRLRTALPHYTGIEQANGRACKLPQLGHDSIQRL